MPSAHSLASSLLALSHPLCSCVWTSTVAYICSFLLCSLQRLKETRICFSLQALNRWRLKTPKGEFDCGYFKGLYVYLYHIVMYCNSNSNPCALLSVSVGRNIRPKRDHFWNLTYYFDSEIEYTWKWFLVSTAILFFYFFKWIFSMAKCFAFSSTCDRSQVYMQTKISSVESVPFLPPNNEHIYLKLDFSRYFVSWYF